MTHDTGSGVEWGAGVRTRELLSPQMIKYKKSFPLSLPSICMWTYISCSVVIDKGRLRDAIKAVDRRMERMERSPKGMTPAEVWGFSGGNMVWEI